MNIGLDIDGVLADFNMAYAHIVKRETGRDLFHLLPPKTWHWDREGGITPAEESKVWRVINNSLFWGSLEPLPLATETLALTNELRIGHNVYFITSRPGVYAKSLTEAWLVNQGAKMPTVLLAIGDAEKGTLAAGLHLDVFIDDKPSNCEEVLNATFDDEELQTCRIFLVSRSYNDTFKHPLIERTDSALAALRQVVEQHGQSLRRTA